MHDRHSPSKPIRACRAAPCLTLLILSGLRFEAAPAEPSADPVPMPARARSVTAGAQYLSSIGAPLLRARDPAAIAEPAGPTIFVAPKPTSSREEAAAGLRESATVVGVNPIAKDEPPPALPRPIEPAPPVLAHAVAPSSPPKFIPQVRSEGWSSPAPVFRDAAPPGIVKVIVLAPPGAFPPVALPPSSATYFQIEK